jgi:hypothetical protein
VKFRITFPGGTSGVFKAHDQHHAVQMAVKKFEFSDTQPTIIVPVCDVCEKAIEPTDPYERQRFIDKTFNLSRRSLRMRTCGNMECAIRALERLVDESSFRLPEQQVISAGGLPLEVSYGSPYTPAPSFFDNPNLIAESIAQGNRYFCQNEKCNGLGFHSYQDFRDHKKNVHSY